MNHALDQPSRTLVLSMNLSESAEAFRVAATAASGALGIKLLEWARRSWSHKTQQAGEWQIRVLDDGAKVREEERAENKALRIESRENLDRAHRSEIEGVGLRNENATLRTRLARKDEQLKALSKQLIQLGKVPVTFEPDWQDGTEEPYPQAHPHGAHGGNGRNAGASQSIDPSGNGMVEG